MYLYCLKSLFLPFLILFNFFVNQGSSKVEEWTTARGKQRNKILFNFSWNILLQETMLDWSKLQSNPASKCCEYVLVSPPEVTFIKRDALSCRHASDSIQNNCYDRMEIIPWYYKSYRSMYCYIQIINIIICNKLLRKSARIVRWERTSSLFT